MKKLLILSGVLLLSQLIAQSSSQSSTLKDAFLHFEHKNYSAAIPGFEIAQKSEAAESNVLNALALCYKRTAQFEKADVLYSQLLQSTQIDPDAFYEYADMLRGQGDFMKAKKYFLEYAKHNPVIGNYFAETCDYAYQQLQKPNNCKLSNLESNTSHADFAPVIVNEQLVFVSGQKNDFNIKSAEAKPIQSGLSELLAREARGFGNISIAEDNSFCVFSKAADYELQRILMHDIKLEIHTADINAAGSWTNIRPFAFNVEGYSVGFPCLAEKGRVLYFASNKPGGYGGYDIYVSFLNEENKWTEPANLGAVINSDGNELSPFYKNGSLYFSSDWHTGFGGLDVFKTQLSEGNTGLVENLGTCVNSSMDEYYFILDKENEAYFTSNRYGGKGADDIYHSFQLKLSQDQKAPVLHVIETKEVTKIEEPARITEEHLVSAGTLVAEELVPQTKKLAQNPKLYFIQITSLTKYNSKMDERFVKFAAYGDVYKVKVDEVMKIRIGSFTDINEAIAAMKIIKANGAKDAFIVSDIVNDERASLIAKAVSKSEAPKVGEPKESEKPMPVEDEEEGGKYKIRVSEYKAPDWFDVSKISDLGKIEHWTKNGWTIIVLGNYKTEPAAKEALGKLKSRGFKEAYLVVEENGKLYRL